MRCDELEPLIEPIAGGDLGLTAEVSAHLASCLTCAASLAFARRLERLLQAREAPPAPADLAANVLSRVHRERWRSERYLDLGFNIAIGLALVLIGGGILLMMNASGLAGLGGDALGLFATGLVALAERVARALPIYGAATALLMTALAVWWWAEKGLT